LIISSQIFLSTLTELCLLDREIPFLLYLPKSKSVWSEKPAGGALHRLFPISEPNHEKYFRERENSDIRDFFGGRGGGGGV